MPGSRKTLLYAGLAHMKGNWQGKSLTALCLHIPVLLLVLEHLQPRTLSQKGKVGPCWWKGGLSKFICPQQRSTYSFSHASFGRRTRQSSEYAKARLREGWSCKFRGILASIGCSANSLKKKQHKENGSTPKSSRDKE